MKARVRLAFAALPLLLLSAAPPQQQAPVRAGPSAVTQTGQLLVMLRLPPVHVRGGATYSGSYGDAASQVARRRIVNGLARKYGMRVSDSWPMPLLGVDCFVLDLPPGLTVDQAIELFSPHKTVLWAQPMQLYQGSGQSGGGGDPLFAAQPAASAWRLADLHRYSTGRHVSVAVIDSKIDTAHPDLAGQFTTSRDFVGARAGAEQHGTGVAGVIGAKANNGLGIAGVAPDARLMALRACWESEGGSAPTLCSTLTLARAIQFAIDHDAQIINLSISGPPDPLLGKLIDIAISRGIAVVAAYDASVPQGGFPASRPGVIAVGDESLRSRPPTVYGAPGQDIPTTQPGGRWYVVNGSSYAVAHVTGLLALVREQRGRVPLRISVRPSGTIVDACATLMRVTPDCDCSCAIRTTAKTAGRH